MGIFPNFRGEHENQKWLKPPPSKAFWGALNFWFSTPAEFHPPEKSWKTLSSWKLENLCKMNERLEPKWTSGSTKTFKDYSFVSWNWTKSRCFEKWHFWITENSEKSSGCLLSCVFAGGFKSKNLSNCEEFVKKITSIRNPTWSVFSQCQGAPVFKATDKTSSYSVSSNLRGLAVLNGK